MRCNILQIYTGYIILLSAILNVSSNNANLNKENNLMQNNDAKEDISSFQMFSIIFAILLFTLMIMIFFQYYWIWYERQRKGEEKLATLPYARRYVRVNPDIELKNREQQRTSRTESCVGPSDERTEICNPEHKNKHGSKLSYKSKNKKSEQNRRQYKHKNKDKRKDESKDEGKDEDQQIWHINEGYISDNDDIKKPLLSTLEHVLPKSSKMSASSQPGPSRRKSSGSGVSVDAIKITHEAEVYATIEKND